MLIVGESRMLPRGNLFNVFALATFEYAEFPPALKARTR